MKLTVSQAMESYKAVKCKLYDDRYIFIIRGEDNWYTVYFTNGEGDVLKELHTSSKQTAETQAEYWKWNGI